MSAEQQVVLLTGKCFYHIDHNRMLKPLCETCALKSPNAWWWAKGFGENDVHCSKCKSLIWEGFDEDCCDCDDARQA